MRKSRWILILTIFLAFVCIGAPCWKKKKKKPIIPPPPNWDVWSDPDSVLALDETDPQGDHLGFGSTSDWSLMKGTFDAWYVYIHVDVYSSPAIDQSGNTWYALCFDCNDNGDFDIGDYFLNLTWPEELLVGDHDANLVDIGASYQVNPNGGIDFAIPRGIFNPYEFGVLALAKYWTGTSWQDGDVMPNAEQMMKFMFLPPDWDVWNQPGLVLALDETDPQGDDLGFGSTADFSEMQGTYDNNFVYIHIDVYSSPALDTTEDIEYILAVDVNNSGDMEQGDYFIRSTGTGGYMIVDNDLNPVSIGAGCRVNPAGGLDFAFPRRLVNPVEFGVAAVIIHWEGDNYEFGDEMPPDPQWATFSF